MPLSRQTKSISRRMSAQQQKPVALLKRLSSENVKVPKRQEVLAYLVRYKQLAKLVPEICMQIRHAFGPNAELSLELYRDPEIDDRYLTLYIRQQTYDPEIMEKIETECRRFNGNLEQVSGYLLVTTDFRQPGNNHAI